MANDPQGVGVSLSIPEGAKIANCPDCGELLFVIQMDNGQEVLAQPVVVRGLIPARELVQLHSPPSPEDLIKKLVSRTATARMSPPIIIPHNLVCIRAPLVRTIPAPTKLAAMGPEPKAEAPEDPKKPPPGHVPKVHDLEIQSGKMGTSSKIPGDDEDAN